MASDQEKKIDPIPAPAITVNIAKRSKYACGCEETVVQVDAKATILIQYCDAHIRDNNPRSLRGWPPKFSQTEIVVGSVGGNTVAPIELTHVRCPLCTGWLFVKHKDMKFSGVDNTVYCPSCKRYSAVGNLVNG